MVNTLKSIGAIVTAFGLVMLGACSSSDSGDSSAQPPTINGRLAISGYYYSEPPPVDNADLVQRLQQVRDLQQQAGVNGQFSSYRWSDLEPNVGNYDMAKLSEFADTMAYAESVGYRQLVGLQIINTVRREVPAELAGVAWNDPAMIGALENLLDVLLPYMADSVDYLSLGNEVDSYFFAGRTAELDGYRQLVDTLKTYIQNREPAIKVGITVTATGGWLAGNVQAILDLTQNNDVLIATYYPLNSDFTVRPANSPLADFPSILAYADGRPLVLQEVGYPAAIDSNSSEAQQAAFVRNTFAAWRNAGDDIGLLNMFLLHDFSTDLVDTFVAYYGINDFRYRAYLDSLGLRNRDNTDKAAWPALLQAAQDAGF